MKISLKKMKYLLASFIVCNQLNIVDAANITWVGTTNSMDTGTNWSPANVPFTNDTALFNNAATSTTPFLQSNLFIQECRFLANAPSYNFLFGSSSICRLTNVGVTNLSSNTQNFNLNNLLVLTQASLGDNTAYNIFNGSTLNFLSSSSAGTASITNNNGGTIVTNDSTMSQSTITQSNNSFTVLNNSTLNLATITNNDSQVILNSNSTLAQSTINQSGTAKITLTNSLGGSGLVNSDIGAEILLTNSNAENSTFNMTNSSSLTLSGSSLSNATLNIASQSAAFINSSSSNAATITLNASNMFYDFNSTAASSQISGQSNSFIQFVTGTTAASSTITLNDSALAFSSNSTGGSSTINLTNSTANFEGQSNAGTAQVNGFLNSSVMFKDSAVADQSVFNLDNSAILFEDSSLGNNATANLDHSLATFSGSSSGNQISFFTSNASTITFTENAFSADTFISLDASSLVNFSQTGPDNFNGTLLGLGQVQKNGPGLLNFTALALLFDGETQITNGNFALNSTLGGDILVNNLGTLSGNGLAIGNVHLESGGTISPGNSIGTLAIGGNYIQDAGTTYLVELNGASQSDLIDIDGTATINGGTVAAVSTDGTYSIETPYTILNAAGGVTGTYDSALFLSSLLVSPELVYDPQNIFLILSPNLVSFAGTPNQINVATQLETITNPSPALAAVLNNLITLSSEQITTALDQMGGEQYTSLIQSTRLSSQRFLRRMYDPLRDLLLERRCFNPCDNNIDFWFAGQGGYSRIRSDRNAHSYHINDYNITAGLQKRFCEQWTVGLAAAYERDRIHYNLGGSGKLDYTQGALYGAYIDPNFYVLSNLVVSYNECKIKRQINFGTIDLEAHGKPKIFETAFYNELGINLVGNSFTVQPFVGLEFDYLHRNRFTETNADPLNLRVNSRELYLFTTRLGVHTQADLACGLEVNIDVAWQHNFNFNRDRIQTNFTDFGTTFPIIGVKIDRDSVDGTVNLTKNFNERFNIYAEVSGQAWSHFANYNVTGGFQYNW